MKSIYRLSVTVCAAAAMGLGTAGVASADTAASDVPIWVLPGVDAGGLLGPTVGLPGALAPVFDLFKLIGA